MCLPLAILGPIIGGAVAAGGSAVAGAVGSENARAAQESAADKAMALQRETMAQQQRNYDQSRADMAPWLETGRTSLADLASQMSAGSFNTTMDSTQLAADPGYQFRMAEGQKALERSASARGMLNSGGALRSLSRYSQGVASDEYQNAWSRNQAEASGRFNRLASLAGVGQTAAQNLGSMGGQFSAQMGQGANNMSSLYGAMGNAQAAGAMGAANAVGGGFNTFGALLGHGLSNGGQQQIPTQNYGYQGSTPSYGQSTMGYPTQGFGPWR